MFDIAGKVQRAFTFPARLPATRAYFSDFQHIVTLLPHIRLIKPLGAGQFRVQYRTLELGVYEVRLVCDLHVHWDEARSALRVSALPALPPVKPKATLRSLTAPARYHSTSVLVEAGAETRVDYRLELGARLPKPTGLTVVPDKTMERIAHSIVLWRIHEIADGFIERSLADYQKQHGRRRPASSKE